jgi:hypothetical protein
MRQYVFSSSLSRGHPRGVEDQLRMTVQLAAPPAKPLPVIVNPIVDELLSSWLKRTAHIYGASARDVLTHFGVKPPDSLRQMGLCAAA